MQNLERKFTSPDKNDTSHLAADEAEFYSLLNEFLEKLETLALEDVSKNIPFMHSLSTIWEKLFMLESEECA